MLYSKYGRKGGFLLLPVPAKLVQQCTGGRISPLFKIFVNDSPILFYEYLKGSFGNISHVEHFLIWYLFNALLIHFRRKGSSGNHSAIFLKHLFEGLRLEIF